MPEQATTQDTPQPLDPLLTLREVSQTVGLQSSAIYGRIQRGEFPSGVLLSRRCRRWRRSTIAAWLESLA